jgi:asparagine synthase (glutamine-hydrolysing)
MCGIVATFAYGAGAPPVDRAEVIRMREQMFARGPDGEGEWFSDDGRVGFGHRRLTIIDLSPAGAQPMWNADRSLAIIFNGEIYNYAELRAQLSHRAVGRYGVPARKASSSERLEAANGYQFRSHCDTEVLLALYETRGEAMLNELRGMYAFVIWDRNKEGIFLARDPFGIKPLYYSDNGNTFRVASQVKPLRDCGKIDLGPDPAGHVGYFLWGHVPDPYTMFRNIRSLPAGSTMWVGRDGPHAPREFCSISRILADAEADRRGLSVNDYQLSGKSSAGTNNRERITDNRDELLRSALSETVKYHLVADVPVGVFLSSGLDSTTIAALAAEQGGDLRTVTLGFKEYKGTAEDEVPLAEQFAHRCGARHQTIWVSRADFEAERDHLFESMDRPSTDGVNTFFVSLAAKRAGLKVALSGVGGDELFASYPSFQEIPRSVRWLKGFHWWREIGRDIRIVTAPIIKRFTSPKYAGIFEYGSTYSGAYLLRRGMFMPWELPELLDPEVVREGWAELQTLLRLDETLDGIKNPRLKVSALEMNWYMRNQLLRDSDWAGMGHSVEIRVPFVDFDLLRAMAPLLAGKHPPSKRDMAQSAISHLPSSLLERPKTGFQVPVREWLRDERGRADFEIVGPAHRGLRGWAREVYSHFVSNALPIKRCSSRRRVDRNEGSQGATPHKVLMLLSDAFGGFGGIAKFNRDFLTALCANRAIERVIAVPRVASEESEPLPSKLTYATSALAGKPHFMSATLSAAYQLQGNRKKTIIICGHIHLLPAALTARTICGGQLYLIVHGVDAWKPSRNPILNACVPHIDDFIAVSTVTRRRFLRWSGLRQDQGMILPNCVDLSVFTPGEKSETLLARYGLRNRTILITLGRLAEEERYKGFDEVLEVLPLLAIDVPDITYLIVGDGPDRIRLEKKAQRLDIADRVVFAGRISEKEKPDHYRLADAYVMPSSGEGFGIVYLEALACGIPVIGSKIDGSRDALRDGRLGILVNPTDSAELRGAILRTLAEKKSGVEGRRNGVAYFSTDRFRQRVFDIIDAITTAPERDSAGVLLTNGSEERGAVARQQDHETKGSGEL